MDVLVEFGACAQRLIFLRLPAMSHIFECVKNVRTACDTLRLLES